MEKLTINSRVKMNDGNSIPLLGFGVFQAEDAMECQNAVECALEAGYRHIDTATVYRNEEFVGNGLASCGISREDLFITTKYFPRKNGSPRAELSKSLEKLKTDYIDLYLIHWPVENYEESWIELMKLQQEGLCRSIGVSNYTVKRFEKDFFPAHENAPAVNQMELHTFYQRKELVEYCINKGMIMEAYSPLARAKKMDNPLLLSLASDMGKSPAQIMIRFLLQKGIVALPKSVTPSRIKSNADVFDFNLDEKTMELLDGLDADYSALGWRPEGFY